MYKQKFKMISTVLIIIFCLSMPLLYIEASSGVDDNKTMEDKAKLAFEALIQSYYDNWEMIEGYHELEGFEVTSGLPAEGDNTFVYARSIKGTAPRDTVITITIYMYDESISELYITNTISIDPIGAFEFFDKTVQLESGDNYIIVTAANHPSYALASSVIKCKDFGIKIKLENGIAFPGQWTNIQDNEPN